MTQKKDTFFVTTPIYYANGVPHIGHAYSSMLADTIARYQKISGKDIKFSTGVDENSQKAVQKAEEEQMEILPYLDTMTGFHKTVWDGLGIEYTDFIRTTQKRHHDFVREVLQKTFDNGDIYEGIYEGMYCVGCEGFKKDDDLILRDGKKVCPDHLTEPQKLKEKNYFFRLSKYQDSLLDFYEKNPEFVIPSERFNEVKAFVKRGLDDFSISRETNKFGIKLPFDEEQVTYVWYDALLNYITVCASPDKGGNDMNFWPADLHIVGKDIIRFHAIYWPAMLMSVGYELPKKILTTGYLTVDGQKISKSLGNAIDPVEFSKNYSKDMLVLYLLSNVIVGQDGDFDQKEAILTYNAKLANNLGNLVNRVVVLALKLDGKLEGSIDTTTDVGNTIQIFQKQVYSDLQYYELKKALDVSFCLLDELNNYTTEKEPWQLIKDESRQGETREVLYTIAEGLRKVGLFLYSFFPEKMHEMFYKLGLHEYGTRLENGELLNILEELPAFEIKEKGEPLFKRFDLE